MNDDMKIVAESLSKIAQSIKPEGEDSLAAVFDSSLNRVASALNHQAEAIDALAVAVGNGLFEVAEAVKSFKPEEPGITIEEGKKQHG